MFTRPSAPWGDREATDVNRADLAVAEDHLPGPWPAYQPSWRGRLHRDAATNRD